MSRPRASQLGSLKSRLALWVLLPIVLISSVDLVVTYKRTGEIATLVQQQLLKGSAKIISEQLAKVDGGYEISVPPAAFELFASGYHDRVFYAVRSKGGLLIAGDADLPPYAQPLQVDQQAFFLATVRGEPVRVIAYKNALPSTTSDDYAVTQIAQTLHGHDAFRHDLFRLTIREHLMLLSILAIGLVIAFRWTLRPLIEFGENLLQRQPGSLERLEQDKAPVELTPIIFAMNDYVARLDKTLGAYGQFVANTAHHLRTSFAILTSQINFGRRNPALDPTQREVLDAMQQSVAHGSKIINQLLLLAAVEQHRHSPPAASETAVAEAIRDVLEELAPLAQQKKIELGIDDIDDAIRIEAAPRLLREVLTNLLDNSIQHMPAGGSVTVSLARDGAAAQLRVTDTGPGIPPADRQRVFERFCRLDDSKPNSSGLGLAIVKEICDSLSGSVMLRTPDNGVGLQVEVRLPLAASALPIV